MDSDDIKMRLDGLTDMIKLVYLPLLKEKQE
jgi:hypothetical protein